MAIGRRTMNWFRAGVLAILAGPAGCGSGEVPLVPVTGRIQFRGQPLAGGTVVFTPDPERGGRGPQAWAEIRPDGGFTLETHHRPGAVPGWHRITVVAQHGGETPASLPGRYCDPELSGQVREVKAAQANYVDLHLE